MSNIPLHQVVLALQVMKRHGGFPHSTNVQRYLAHVAQYPTGVSDSHLAISLHDFDIEDFDILLRLLFIYSRVLDLMDNIQALNRSSEDCVFVVQPRLEQLASFDPE